MLKKKKAQEIVEWTRIWSKSCKKVDADLKFLTQAVDTCQIIKLHKTFFYSSKLSPAFFFFSTVQAYGLNHLMALS